MIRNRSIKALLTPSDIDVSPVLIKSKPPRRERESAKQTMFSANCRDGLHYRCTALKCTCSCHDNEVGR